MGWICRHKIFSLPLARMAAALFLLAPAVSWSHPNHDLLAPVRPTDLHPSDAWGPTRGGYGYVGPSEAEAYWLMGFQCEPGEPLQCVESPSWEWISKKGEELSNFVMSTLFLQKVRASAFEYLAIHLASLNSDRSQDFPPPACLGQQPEWKDFYRRLPLRLPEGKELTALTADRLATMNKFRAVQGTMSSGNIIRTLIYHDNLKAAEKVACAPDGRQTTCTDVTNQLKRMRDAIPLLFRGTPDASDRRINKLRTEIHTLLGARDLTVPALEKAKAGKALYDEAFSNIYNSRASIDLEKAVAERMDEARQQDPATDPQVNRALGVALEGLNAEMDRMKRQFAEDIKKSVNKICDLNLDGIMEVAPNVMRQALLEIPAEQRPLVRQILCNSGLLSRVQIKPQCTGFEMEENAEATVYRINQRRSQFPFGANVNYELTEPKNGENRKVTLTVHVASDLSEEELNKTLRSWEEKTSGWFNCQSGSATAYPKNSPDSSQKCPSAHGMPKPPLEFAVKYKAAPMDSSESPLVKLTRCVRSELPADKRSDCKEARQFRLNQCLETYVLRQKSGGAKADSRYGKDIDQILVASGKEKDELVTQEKTEIPDFINDTEEQLKARCEKDIPPEGDPKNNRANAAHFTTAISDGTLFHEIGHLLGLPDEYKDPAYPFSPLGEHNSIMNSSSNPKSILYPRHLEQILAVKACSKSTEAERAVK